MELSMELFAEICRPAILSSVLPAGCADLKETAGRRLPDGRARGILNGERLSRARPPGGSGGCGKKAPGPSHFAPKEHRHGLQRTDQKL